MLAFSLLVKEAMLMSMTDKSSLTKLNFKKRRLLTGNISGKIRNSGNILLKYNGRSNIESIPFD